MWTVVDHRGSVGPTFMMMNLNKKRLGVPYFLPVNRNHSSYRILLHLLCLPCVAPSDTRRTSPAARDRDPAHACDRVRRAPVLWSFSVEGRPHQSPRKRVLFEYDQGASWRVERKVWRTPWARGRHLSQSATPGKRIVYSSKKKSYDLCFYCVLYIIYKL